MHIVYYHEGILPVQRYGGTERIVCWLIEELQQLGVRCSIISHPKTSLPGLIPRDPAQDWRSQIPKDADILHLFHNEKKHLPLPSLTTIQGNGQPGEVFDQNTVFISQKHASLHGATHFIYNGIPFKEYPLGKGARRGFCFLAKARWPVKNLTGARRAARLSRQPLDIAGGWGLPLLPPRERFWGMVDHAKKVELLIRSRGLLFPVRWHEPFGIAMVEAMACGTAVIGSNYGSLPEVISPDRGVTVNSQKQLESCLKNWKDFHPASVRESAEQKFSSALMAKSYLEAFQYVLQGNKLQPKPPATISSAHPEELLPW